MRCMNLSHTSSSSSKQPIARALLSSSANDLKASHQLSATTDHGPLVLTQDRGLNLRIAIVVPNRPHDESNDET